MDEHGRWLLDAIKSSSGTVKANLIPSLSMLDGELSTVMAIVPSLMTDPDDAVKCATLQLLVELDLDALQYIDILRPLVASQSEMVRQWVSTYLIKQPRMTSEVDELLRLLFCDQSDRVRIIAASRLCQYDVSNDIESFFLRVLRTGQDPLDRATAVAGLAHCKPLATETYTAIVRSLNDSHPLVIANAIATLTDHELFTGDLRNTIEQLQSHRDEFVRAAAAEFLTNRRL